MNVLARAPAPLRIGAFSGLLALAWLPVAPAYAVLPANAAAIAGTSWLLVAFGLLLWGWNRWLYGRAPEYGLRWDRQQARWLALGFGVGATLVLGLFVLQVALGWRMLAVGSGVGRLALEGILSAIAVGVGEELLFRGWLLDELERDYAPPLALGVDAGLFALAHYLKPPAVMLATLPQLPGLLLLGVVLVRAQRRAGGRLGLAIGLHAGLVWGYYLVAVGEWVGPPQVASWLVGIDDNPLAGALGWAGLSGLGVWLRPRRR